MRKRQEEKKSRINICFLSGDITRSGGTERVACMIANGLCRYREFRVSVLSLVEQDPERQTFFDLDEHIPHRALLNRQIQPGPEYAALIPVLRRFFIKRKIDVVIDIDIVLDVLSVPAACGMRTKVISWEHFNFTYETARRYGYRDLIVRHLTTKADVIVTLTQKDRQAFLRGLSKQGNTQKRMPEIRTIPNPIQNLPLQETAEKKRWIVTVGRLTYQKGVDYLLRTARIVLKKYPNWQWLLLGDGDQKEWLKGQIQKYHLQQRLLVKGNVTDVDSYLAKAQIFVLTSRWEGLPMCLLEAKAHRLACVSFAIETGPDEVITDRYNGYLVSAFDCAKMARRIGTLIENEQLRRTLMKNAEKGIEKFQMESILNQWNEVLKDLCV